MQMGYIWVIWPNLQFVTLTSYITPHSSKCTAAAGNSQHLTYWNQANVAPTAFGAQPRNHHPLPHWVQHPGSGWVNDPAMFSFLPGGQPLLPSQVWLVVYLVLLVTQLDHGCQRTGLPIPAAARKAKFSVFRVNPNTSIEEPVFAMYRGSPSVQDFSQ